MKTIIDFKKTIEREVMVAIIMGLRYGTITQEKAQKIAQEYLDCASKSTSDELFATLHKKIERYSELLEVYLRCADEYFEERKNQLLADVRNHISQIITQPILVDVKGGTIHG